MRRHCARLTAAATLTLVFSLAPATQKPGAEFDAPTRTTPPPSPHAAKGVQYENVTAASGLSHFSHVAGDPLKPYLPETIGSGVALFDYDNDGWLDICLVNALSSPARKGQAAAQSSALFRNNKDGTFIEATLKAGVGNNRWGAGVCAGDFNNDGWADLYVTNLGRSRLYRNNKDGTFTDVAEKAGVAVETWSTGCAFGDYDRDGQLDLYVAGYVQFDWNAPPPAGELSDAPLAALVTPVDQGARMGAAYDSGAPFCTFLGLRVACGPRGLKGAPDFLFRNNGDGTFTNTTRRAGVEDSHGYYGFSVAWVDIDDDRWPDIVVANDSRPNYVYHNRRDGTFEEIGLLTGLATNGEGREQAYMGMAVGDYDRDGRDDFFFTTFSDDSYTLQRNSGNLDFGDVTELAGLGTVTVPFLGWGAEFLDYDNDGSLDILAANGHVYPQIDRLRRSTSYRQRTLLFRQLRDGRFADVTGSLGSGFTEPKSSRGAAVGDLFNDGDLDIVLNNLDGPPTLLRNRGGNRSGHWISLKLIGNPLVKTPRDATGTVVFCYAGGFRQRGEVASGRGYISQSDLRVHFGLGSATAVEKLEILWSNGSQETVAVPAVDRHFTIVQEKGIQK
jgi:enediyne biosynthesis protein E4